MSRRRRDQHHVRLYDWEIRSHAYRSLSTDARALLIEFRALYAGQHNRIHMSVRQIRERLGIGQANAQRARDELLDRGFIRLLTAGSFNRKARHATEYALTNEPLDGEHVAPKDYMQWQPPEKSSVLETGTIGTQGEYRDLPERAEKTPHGTQGEYREPAFPAFFGTQGEYTDRLPSGSAKKPAMRGPAQSEVVGDSVACSCGGSTSSSSVRRHGSVLHYQRCGACSRCDRFVMKRGSEVVAVGREAQRRFFENSNASEAAAT